MVLKNMGRAYRRWFPGLLFLVLGGTMAFGRSGPDGQAQPDSDSAGDKTIRVKVKLIPVRVFVSAQDGKISPDLSPADFRLYDDDSPQQINTFIREFSPAEAPTLTANEPVPPEPGRTLSRLMSRTFLILIASGGVYDPFDSTGALIRFVQQNLQPSDRVAVMLYDRVTEFTTRHDQVITLLERYKDQRAKIEVYFWQQAASHGLYWLYGIAIPESIQAAADKIFAGPEVPDSSPLSLSSSSSADVHGLAKAFGFLRRQPEPRFLLFFSDQGLVLPRVALVRNLTNLANEARVVIYPFQTGGLDSGFSRNPLSNPFQRNKTQPRGSLVLTDRELLHAPTSLHQLAEWTGGRAAVHSDIPIALTRMDQMTRNAYLLGYYPEKINWNGRYHRIRVEVNRPGLRLFYRHGYFAYETTGEDSQQ